MSTTLERASERSWIDKAVNLLAFGSGIVIFYSAFGYFQKRITKRTYGPDNEPFIYMQSLVFMQCLVNGLISYIMMKQQHPAADTVPRYKYLFASISYMLSMLLSSFALKWVSINTTVLGKTCKPIPIMLFGVLFAHKKYAFRKYLYVLMIVAGMAVFMYDGKKESNGNGLYQVGPGVLCLILSLIMDGITGAIQDLIRSSHRIDKWTMMFYMNLFASIILSATMFFSGELSSFTSFVRRYPFVDDQIIALSIAGALGQICIFKIVADFGPLTCSIVTALRKLFNLAFSIIFFSHPYNNRQMLGAVLVLLAILFDVLESRKSHHKAVLSEDKSKHEKEA